MDLAVDEQGLCVFWGDTDNAYRLYASKIDVYKNTIIHTRALTTGKSSLVPRRSLLPRCPREVSVTSQLTVQSRIHRAENALGLGWGKSICVIMSFIFSSYLPIFEGFKVAYYNFFLQ